MGGEFGQAHEWSHEAALDWEAAEQPSNRGVQMWIGDLNRVYRAEPALYERDFDATGFEWIDCNDAQASVLSFLRKGRDKSAPVLVVANFTPVPRHNYIIGVPKAGTWTEVLNSDASRYGGSGMGNLGAVQASPIPAHGRPRSLTVTLPPLALLVFRGPDA
jgi:1,4-alpha-glucan branching enzyme